MVRSWAVRCACAHRGCVVTVVYAPGGTSCRMGASCVPQLVPYGSIRDVVLTVAPSRRVVRRWSGTACVRVGRTQGHVAFARLPLCIRVWGRVTRGSACHIRDSMDCTRSRGVQPLQGCG
jgi:hypothetical protein